MKYSKLGKSLLKVSELCFGALPMGPLQKGLRPETGAEVILRAISGGVNFIDTAQSYGTYEHIRLTLKESEREDIVIASKSSAADYEGMIEAVKEALSSLGIKAIDIFHLHAARVTRDVFTERNKALKALVDMKAQGYIRAIGISTHNTKVVELAARNESIDIIHPLINKSGLGILSGGREEMEKAIAFASERGKGIYAMKALGGGHLLDDIEDSIEYVRSLPGIDSVAVGMVDTEEVDFNLRLFLDTKPSVETPTGSENLSEARTSQREKNRLNPSKKHLVVLDFCKKCGACIEACPNNAIKLGESRAESDHERCLLCGYCSPKCPEFAIRIV